MTIFGTFYNFKEKMGLSIDLDIYYRQKKVSQDWFYCQGRGDVDYTVSTLASSTMVPCIVIAIWIGEVNGFDSHLIKKIKGLIKFYGYGDILNTPPNFPAHLFKS